MGTVPSVGGRAWGRCFHALAELSTDLGREVSSLAPGQVATHTCGALTASKVSTGTAVYHPPASRVGLVWKLRPRGAQG